MDHIVDIILSAIPWIEGLISQAKIVVTAIPAWGKVTVSIIPIIGSLYLLVHFKLVPNPIGGDSEDDDNW